MAQTLITIAIVALAAILLLRYFWLEFRNPCRGCTKSCDRRKR